MSPNCRLSALTSSVLILLSISYFARAEAVPDSASPTAPAAPAASAAPAEDSAQAASEPGLPVAVVAKKVLEKEEKPPAGWKVAKRGDKVFWCTISLVTGSRVRTEQQCVTPSQYREMVESARRETEDITRRVIPPSG
jgi:hypothetical protein